MLPLIYVQEIKINLVILQVRAGFMGRGVSRGATSASIFKTVSGRVIHKSFSAVNLFKTKNNTVC
jgi:hypothetical protein